MELRVLRYFLIVAREENITRAAQLLHITQPTLSRQLMQLEEELGVKLFHRSKHHIILTEDGLLLKQRAQEMIMLSDKTIQELSHRSDVLSGEIAIGCGESRNMSFLAEQMKSFNKLYPQVKFSIYSATTDDIKDRIEKGLLDMGLLMEPVNIVRYEFIHMPLREKWAILTRRDSELGNKLVIKPEDLLNTPLLIGKRELVKHEIANWFGEYYEQINIVADYNLLLNAAAMVREGVGVAIGFDLGAIYEDLRVVPLSPALETGAVLAWKRNQTHASATSYFIKHIKNNLDI